jgi:hypothetical protein
MGIEKVSQMACKIAQNRLRGAKMDERQAVQDRSMLN